MINSRLLTTSFVALYIGVGAAFALQTNDYVTATAEMKNLDGTSIGDAKLTETPGGVLVHVRVEQMDPGKKAIHIHSKAHCTASSGFKSSKGHHGEAEGEHGLLNPQGPGTGDLGNIFVGTDGVGEMEFFKTGVSLTGQALPLFDDNGSAIVIHANADDHITQPIGGAGPRIACGMVILND